MTMTIIIRATITLITNIVTSIVDERECVICNALLIHSLRLRFIHVNGLRCVWKQAVQRKLKWLLSARGLLSTWRQYFIITSKKQSRTWKHSQYNRIVETLKGEGALCYLGHWTKQKWLRFVLLRFFFLSRIRKKREFDVWVDGGRRMPRFSFFLFFLYLFLKRTLEDADEADGGGVGAPLSLILTIVSIC